MHLVNQEIEEVGYPAAHEIAWLNEHMAEVFSKSQLSVACYPLMLCTDPSSNFTEVFKTPGKLRGKTPRTARKRNVDESRVVCCPDTSWPD